MSAKDDILKKINKKAKQYKDYKTDSKKSVTKLVARLIDEIEDARVNSKNGLDWSGQVETAINMFGKRLGSIDAAGFAEILWANKEEEVENWQDLQIHGVKIVWSETYLKNNPGSSPEEVITVERLWLEGLD